jgi:lactate dehydrogenase-like 2-hydroxyacid dehydrogenase
VTRPTLLVPSPIMDVVLDGSAERYDVIRLWEADDPDAVLRERGGDVLAVAASGGKRIDATLLAALPALQIVACSTVGYDFVDVDAATGRGVVVTNTPGVLDAEVADTALGILIMTVRELAAAAQYVREGRWASEGPYRLTPLTLAGRTLGILGLGRIGLEIARRAEAFGMGVEYHNRSRRDVPYRYHASAGELAGSVDTLMVVLPGDGSTHHLVDADVLAKLGPDGVLVNIGRGPVVDTDALVAALREGTIAAAGLDVVEGEPKVPQALLDLPNATVVPHVGSASVATRNAMGRLVLENLAAWFDTGAARTPVNA